MECWEIMMEPWLTDSRMNSWQEESKSIPKPGNLATFAP